MRKKQRIRKAGILLPISSLPSPYGIGGFGEQAFKFIDFLKAAGQSYWQVLPLGPTSYGDSPYQTFSAFAGNPYYIDLDFLKEEGLLTAKELDREWGDCPSSVDYGTIFSTRFSVLKAAFARSKHRKSPDFAEFKKENAFWLPDYALFMALKFVNENHSWCEWPEELRLREKSALTKCRKELAEEISFWEFCQYKFACQWKNVKEHANKSGIKIIGDIPIYTALDSADVWAHGSLFQLDDERRPAFVAGVPPDLFSATGQLWGNPLYDWDAMEKDDFTWWKMRMAHTAKLYDVIRIDHFIGVVRYFAIPAGEKTAERGEYRPGPGKKLTDVISASCGGAGIIAEDLGVVIPAVRTLMKKTGYPGMKVLAFAFDGGPDNDNLPCHYSANSVVYGGTHDNETLTGYFNRLKSRELRFAKAYLGVQHRAELPMAVVRAALASVADTAILQMQDWLGLDNSARINLPSSLGENWRWRLTRGELTPELAGEIEKMSVLYDRAEIKIKEDKEEIKAPKKLKKSKKTGKGSGKK